MQISDRKERTKLFKGKLSKREIIENDDSSEGVEIPNESVPVVAGQPKAAIEIAGDEKKTATKIPKPTLKDKIAAKKKSHKKIQQPPQIIVVGIPVMRRRG